MGVPQHSEDVGWYKLGYKLGEKGNAVIAGHLDTVTGAPAVFWNLRQLTPGDTVTISDENKKKLIYHVTDVESYPYNNFPLKEVFGPTSASRLNLITCGGSWNASAHIYSDRVVVYTQLAN
jgi:LPXTG-site transpeptidase (sortase) family protein